jgi:hypothetical protein
MITMKFIIIYIINKYYSIFFILSFTNFLNNNILLHNDDDICMTGIIII